MASEVRGSEMILAEAEQEGTQGLLGNSNGRDVTVLVCTDFHQIKHSTYHHHLESPELIFLWYMVVIYMSYHVI